MPTTEWLKKEFDYGYTSGDILSSRPDERRSSEERECGGSYHYYFTKKVLPLLRPDAHVLELGPGGGDWTRALLTHLPQGAVHTCDFQDVRPWLQPDRYPDRLHCHQVHDSSFDCIKDNSFDLFFSFGVLVHCNKELIAEILKNAIRKVKPGGHAIHNYADWDKLDAWGWEKGCVPTRFQNLPDDDIWWPRNTKQEMVHMARQAGWNVLMEDIDCFKRDGVILLQRPA